MNNSARDIAQSYYRSGSLIFFIKTIFSFLFYRFFSKQDEMKAGWKTNIAADKLELNSAMRKVQWSERGLNAKVAATKAELLEEDIYPLS